MNAEQILELGDALDRALDAAGLEIVVGDSFGGNLIGFRRVPGASVVTRLLRSALIVRRVEAGAAPAPSLQLVAEVEPPDGHAHHHPDVTGEAPA